MTETAATNETQTVVLSRDGLIKTDSKTVLVQPRTMMLPRPPVFYFEPQKPRREVDAGNGFDMIAKGVHQVDPNRDVSYVCVMPNVKLLLETGNPYPKRADQTVKTSSEWPVYLPFANAVWKILERRKEPAKAVDLIDEVVKMSKVGADKPKTAINVLKDVLRDLRLYGLVVSSDPGHRVDRTVWAIAPDFKEALPAE